METRPRGRRKAARASRWGLNGGFDLRGRPLFLPPGVLADKRAVLVELNVLVAVVHQAVAAVGRFDLPAQRALAALQWLLVVVTAREAPDLPSLCRDVVGGGACVSLRLQGVTDHLNLNDARCRKYSLTIRLLSIRICCVMSLPGLL